jgi:enamine deaminase RidA (YjgF/YER057c/UK114 family)
MDPSGRVLHLGDILRQADVVTERLRSLLSGFGASMEDVVKTNAYYMGLNDWEGVVGRRARYFREGPTSTGIVVPESVPGLAIQIDATAYTGPKSFASPANHYPFPFDVPFTHGARAGNMIFVAGQVAYDVHGVMQDHWDLPSQTKRAMDNVGNVLAAFQAGMDDILRLNVYYLGAADWRQSLPVQATYFKAGTTVTNVFVDGGVIPEFGDVIEIDAVAAIPC